MVDSKNYFLQPGYIFVSQDLHLVHIVLGSCVAVCLWDSQKNFGGACHFIYPTAKVGQTNGKIGELAIPHLIRMMQDLGADLSHLRAHVIGGASRIDFNSTIGTDNAAFVGATFDKLHIKVVTKEVGGTYGRKVIYNTMTGKIFVYQTEDIRQSDWY